MSRRTDYAANPNLPDRRSFLAASLAGGMLAVAAPHDLRVSGAAQALENQAEKRAFELHELSIAELQQGMESGRFTAKSLAQQYLDQIETIDRAGPSMRSVIEVNA